MTEKQVGEFLDTLKRWVDNRVNIHLASDEVVQGCHERECDECMEALAATLMNVPRDMLPASLRFTDQD